jgi:hypothetical protein
MSPDNLMLAQYILEYRKLDSLTSELHGFQIDFRETLDILNAFFDPDRAEALCETRDKTRRHPLYRYNGIGKYAANAVAGFHCAFLPHSSKAIKAVSERRAKLSTELPVK